MAAARSVSPGVPGCPDDIYLVEIYIYIYILTKGDVLRTVTGMRVGMHIDRFVYVFILFILLCIKYNAHIDRGYPCFGL